MLPLEWFVFKVLVNDGGKIPSLVCAEPREGRSSQMHIGH